MLLAQLLLERRNDLLLVAQLRMERAGHLPLLVELLRLRCQQLHQGHDLARRPARQLADGQLLQHALTAIALRLCVARAFICAQSINGGYTQHPAKTTPFGQLQPEIPVFEQLQARFKPAGRRLLDYLTAKQYGMDRQEIFQLQAHGIEVQGKHMARHPLFARPGHGLHVGIGCHQRRIGIQRGHQFGEMLRQQPVVIVQEKGVPSLRSLQQGIGRLTALQRLPRLYPPDATREIGAWLPRKRLTTGVDDHDLPVGERLVNDRLNGLCQRFAAHGSDEHRHLNMVVGVLRGWGGRWNHSAQTLGALKNMEAKPAAIGHRGLRAGGATGALRASPLPLLASVVLISTVRCGLRKTHRHRPSARPAGPWPKEGALGQEGATQCQSPGHSTQCSAHIPARSNRRSCTRTPPFR